jgi:hypothetical protein
MKMYPVAVATPSTGRTGILMFVFFAGIAALSVAAIVGSLVVVKRDGYRKVPTRTYALLP